MSHVIVFVSYCSLFCAAEKRVLYSDIAAESSFVRSLTAID